MQTFELSGVLHRARRLTAYEQWELLQTIAPALGTMTEMAFGLRIPGADLVTAAKLLAPLTAMSDAQIGAVAAASCGACERQENGQWVSVETVPRLADLTIMVVAVTAANFNKLFALERPKFDRTAPPYSYKPVEMPGSKDWLYRPVLKGLCKLESLHDGTLRIEQIAEANMALDVSEENEARARKAAEQK